MNETEAWRPWTTDGKSYVGGFVTTYQNRFQFATVRGSGHMVPQYKPYEAKVLISKFLKNETLPVFTPPNYSRNP